MEYSGPARKAASWLAEFAPRQKDVAFVHVNFDDSDEALLEARSLQNEMEWHFFRAGAELERFHSFPRARIEATLDRCRL
mmetsp:Transcript_73801/g.146762  ORF Transcript_73801/g.146762 Transcript_73801/m.146762 type:complete len:80 (+) Transcript_73801:265-504(+)